MVELSDENKRQFFVPRGFAHGFLVLSDEAIFTYKVDNVYSPQTEASLRWNDETVGVKWPIDAKDVILSDKDLNKGTVFEGRKSIWINTKIIYNIGRSDCASDITNLFTNV